MTAATGARRYSPGLDRAAGWVAAAATVLLLYVSFILGGRLLFGADHSPDLAASVLATLIVASVVEPVRTRVEHAVRIRLKSATPTPYDLLADFPRELAGAETGEAAPAVIARMLALGTGVAWAQVWVLAGDQLRLLATYPHDAAVDATPPTLYDSHPREGLRSVTVAHAEHALGVLRVKEQTSRPMSPVEHRLLGGLAAQAGLVLQTAQLRAELSLRLEELTEREHQLRRVRDDLVTTQDGERRRLERDIHDGAQQQLVALTINLKLVKALAAAEPIEARRVLEEQLHATSEAIRTLSDLSGGLLPATLGRDGLASALISATTGNPVPVHIDAPSLPRYPPAVEATLYFCALEAVQNATKHADARHIDIRGSERGGSVHLVVEDDGRGIHVIGMDGGGLGNMRERVTALGGGLDITTHEGRGTTVTATVPVPVPVAAAVS